MLSKEVKEKTEHKILTLVKEEQDILIPYYNFLHKFCKINHLQIKSMDEIIKSVSENEKNKNLKLTRTHFDGVGLNI